MNELAPPELSTDSEPQLVGSVDKAAPRHWIGMVLPKRHARRSVTRNLLRRQMRVAMERHADLLPAGIWLLRLRQPFLATEFPSAKSQALRERVRSELDAMLGRVVR